jgi:hypothetical protein
VQVLKDNGVFHQLVVFTSLACFSQQAIFDDRIQYHAFVAENRCGQVGLGPF